MPSTTAALTRTGEATRAFQDADEADVAGVWHRSGLAGYTYLPMFQALTREMAGAVFRDHVRPGSDIRVGICDGQIVAFIAMRGAWIDRLYVDPAHWRQGWGTRLIASARQRCPDGLDLVTHQQNLAARALYEREGFVATAFGISPAPESVPDVTYRWRPGLAAALAPAAQSQ